MLTIFDVAGRQIVIVRGRGGDRLTWNGQLNGLPVSEGIYMYRLEVGMERQDGKFVVLR